MKEIRDGEEVEQTDEVAIKIEQDRYDIEYMEVLRGHCTRKNTYA